jgi:hypothetical protein
LHVRAQVTADSLTVTVSKKHFPMHPTSGKPTTFYSEQNKTLAISKDLEDWAAALQVHSVPLLPGSWEKEYGTKNGCSILKSGYGKIGEASPAGSLGNRRLMIIMASASAPCLRDTFSLAYHDGDEGDSAAMKPKSVLPLYGAEISLANGVHQPIAFALIFPVRVFVVHWLTTHSCRLPFRDRFSRAPQEAPVRWSACENLCVGAG